MLHLSLSDVKEKYQKAFVIQNAFDAFWIHIFSVAHQDSCMQEAEPETHRNNTIVVAVFEVPATTCDTRLNWHKLTGGDGKSS